MNLLRNFIIDYDKYYSDPHNVVVFVDESYIHDTRCCRRSFAPKNDTNFDEKIGKGRRLIIIHAITKFGPLIDRVNNIPVEHLKWGEKRPSDSCISEMIKEKKTNYKNLWILSSSRGDFHNMMNSNMFIEFIEKN